MIKTVASLIVALIVMLSGVSWSSQTPSEFTSVIPTPPPFRTFLPMVVMPSSKKCVAITDTADIGNIWEVGPNCTYAYWPYTYSGSVEVINMLQLGDPYTLTNNSQYFLGWNEPDLKGITPEWAASQWPAAVKANASKRPVSPAPSHLHPEWISRFYQSHIAQWGYPPKLDVLAIHCYLPATQCIAMISQIISLSTQWGIPQVWVTEFGYYEADWQSQAQILIDWMQSQPKITRFYWFSFRANTYPSYLTNLVNDNGALTDKGIFYKSVR